MKPITLPSVIIKKDKQGNILSSAPLDTKDVKSTNEIIYNPLNERMTVNSTLTKSSNTYNMDAHKELADQEYYKTDSVEVSPFNDPKNITNRQSIGYSHNYDNNKFGCGKNTKPEYDFSMYNINREFSQWLRHPYSDCQQNQCRFPTPSHYGAIFINYSKGIQYLFTEEDGIQYLSQYVDKDDNYYIIPPMDAWLVDKNLNYFSRILPPEDIKSAKIPIKYDSNWKKNIMEEKYDMILTPSIDLLDGIRVSKVRPTAAMAYLQPPFIVAPDADSTYQPLGALEGMTKESFGTISLGLFWFILILVIVSALVQYYNVDVIGRLNKLKDGIMDMFKKDE